VVGGVGHIIWCVVQTPESARGAAMPPHRMLDIVLPGTRIL
jgi:hypothetical protein